MLELPSSLPEWLYTKPHFPHVKSAYSTVLSLYTGVKSQDLPSASDKEQRERNLMYLRIVGYLLIYAPTEQAPVCVHKEIVSCEGDLGKVIELGEVYYTHYLRAFRSNKGRIPTPSTHPSRPSFDRKSDAIKPELIESPQNHADAKAQALVRDGYRCVVTGQYDNESIRKDPDLYKKYKEFGKGPLFTECAHIIPSIKMNLDNSNKKEYAANIWTILANFGYTGLHRGLHHKNNHHLENTLTLSHDVHMSFDSLRLWFSATETPNRYKVETDMEYIDLPPYVTFMSSRPGLPLPSPGYLRLHAACAKVAHLSGAAEYIEKVLRDLESIPLLSEDGSLADLLKDALLYAQIRA